MSSILIVEDNKDMQFILKNILEMAHYHVLSVGNGTRAIAEVQENRPDLVLLDMKLPGMNGMDVLDKLREKYPNILVIMMTAYGDVKEAVNAMKLGAYDYITKPFDNEELMLIIEKALQNESLSREVLKLREKLNNQTNNEKEMGKSKEIQSVIRKVNLIAPTDMCVILQGKSGTGKEVIAQMIHQKSNRRINSFVAVDCGAIPATLIESELFGHEAGSFTGAIKRKIGKFEEAHGGTLLLDEITNLSMSGQAKLLRALETKRIHRVGGKKDVYVNVRIIVTTNLSFLEVVKQGEFRDDLYHRLNEFQILLPDLNKRSEDISILANQFLREANRDLGKSVKRFSNKVLQEFTKYSWPGNVRELLHVVKRATLMCEGDVIEMDSIIFELEIDESSSFNLDALGNGGSFNDIIANTEKEVILKALKMSKNNRTLAAEILKMNRKTLYRKMNSLDIK